MSGNAASGAQGTARGQGEDSKAQGLASGTQIAASGVQEAASGTRGKSSEGCWRLGSYSRGIRPSRQIPQGYCLMAPAWAMALCLSWGPSQGLCSVLGVRGRRVCPERESLTTKAVWQ